MDTETTGLDYRKDELKLIQFATKDREVYLVQNPHPDSTYIKALLRRKHAQYVFHHSLFDLRFIFSGLGSFPLGRFNCTKVLMKMVHPNMRSSLAPALRETLDVHISKKEQVSDWGAQLTQEQINYAAADTVDLIPLYNILYSKLSPAQEPIYHYAIEGIAAKACIEVQGYTDLLDYAQEEFDISNENRNWWLRRQHTIY